MQVSDRRGVTADPETDHWIEAYPGALGRTTIWRVALELDEASRSACQSLLEGAERSRADRFLRQEDRDRFLASHAGLRLILGGALGIRPRDVRFAHGNAGKPELSELRDQELHFNLSHSGRWGLVGVSRLPIGVDVEHIRPIESLDLAQRFFAQREAEDLEAKHLAGVPQRECRDAFYACWTRKEAVVKAIGLGLAFPLDKFAVTVPPHPPAVVEYDHEGVVASDWSIRHLEPGADYVGAAAIANPAHEFELRSLPLEWANWMP